jgi:hypothetical protein
MTAAIHKVNSPERTALVYLSQASSGHGPCGYGVRRSIRNQSHIISMEVKCLK